MLIYKLPTSTYTVHEYPISIFKEKAVDIKNLTGVSKELTL